MLKGPAILALFSLTLGAPGVAAQWSVSVELGVARFGGTSRDSAGATVGPYRPTTFELRLERGSGRARVAVGVLHANTGLVAEGEGVAVVQYGIGSLWEIAPEVSLGVARFGAGLEARVAAGPAFDLWNFDGEQRNRVGGRATGVVEWPLARALVGSLRVSGVWSGSVFDPGDAPSGVERRATRRFGVALGVRYRLSARMHERARVIPGPLCVRGTRPSHQSWVGWDHGAHHRYRRQRRGAGNHASCLGESRARGPGGD